MRKMKRVMVTGGCGSIGSMIVDELLKKKGIEKVYSLDINEYAGYKQGLKYENDQRFEFVLKDINRFGPLDEIRFLIDTVYHCAAYKHVPMSQSLSNHDAYYHTIYDGTKTIVDFSRQNGVSRLVNLSTDKAETTHTLSYMAYVKREAETQVLKWGYTNVRLPNVFGTRGSVVDNWLTLPPGVLPVVHDCTRWFCTPEEATKFILKAEGNRTLTMPRKHYKAVRITSLASLFSDRVVMKPLRDGDSKHETYNGRSSADGPFYTEKEMVIMIEKEKERRRLT